MECWSSAVPLLHRSITPISLASVPIHHTFSKMASVIARIARHTPAMMMLRLRRRFSFSSGLSFTINFASAPRPICLTCEAPLVVSIGPCGAGLRTGALTGREAGIGARGCGAVAAPG